MKNPKYAIIEGGKSSLSNETLQKLLDQYGPGLAIYSFEEAITLNLPRPNLQLLNPAPSNISK